MARQQPPLRSLVGKLARRGTRSRPHHRHDRNIESGQYQLLPLCNVGATIRRMRWGVRGRVWRAFPDVIARCPAISLAHRRTSSPGHGNP